MLKERHRKLVARARALLPWASFAFGLITGILMDRKPERAPIVAIAACAGWLALSAVLVGGKLLADRMEKRRALAEKLIAFGHFSGTQSLTQLCVFFSFPFYLQAASLRVEHALFLILLAGAAVLSLWDPLYQAVLERPWARAPLQAFATFAGLNCVFPMLGLSNRVSLYLAAFATVAGSPLIASLGRRLKEGANKALILQLAAASVIPFLLFVGASSAVPPAPLGLTSIGVGTRIEDKQLVDPTRSFPALPGQVACFSAIRAPRGLRDQLFHVWRLGRSERDRVPLDVVGGREAGYRTWSIKRKLGKDPLGKWSCAVETATGQVLGAATFSIGVDGG